LSFGGSPFSAESCTRSPASYHLFPSGLTKTSSMSGQSTPATPAAVLHDTPLIGQSRPRSMVMDFGAPPLQPTVVFCVQK